MNRLYPPLAAALVLLGLALAWVCQPRVAARPGFDPASQAPVKTLGVASCASAACHHGNGPRGSRGSEYSTWVAVDPHARAYQALFCPDSLRILSALARSDPKRFHLPPNQEPLCLRCHGLGDGVPPALHGDGAGCERCHGPAERWVSTHYLPGFDRSTPGFADLRNDLAIRAGVCMKCHVGAGPGQEVDHDLIAAGHPRLRFEYSAYYANYPRHWPDRDRELHGPDVEARSWLIGQLVAAAAALELLAARAAPDRDAWPEFSEYSCAACHHALKKESFRQERDLKALLTGKKRRLGELPWGRWYYPLLATLASSGPGPSPGFGGLVVGGLEEIDRDMRRPLPPAGRVRAQARGTALLLGRWAEFVRALPPDGGVAFPPAQVRGLMAALARRADLTDEGWDSATQVYLGLAALHQALGDLDPPFREVSPLRPPLLHMRRHLVEAFPPGARPAYDTPAGYDPAVLRRDLEAVRSRLK